MDSREVPPPPSQLQPPSSAMLMGHNPYHVNNRNPNAMIGNPNSTSPAIHHTSAAGLRLPFGSLAPQQQPLPQQEPKALDSLGFDGSPSSAQSSMRFGGVMEQQTKKKRGRPRKYAPDGNIALGLAPTTPIPSASAAGTGSAVGGGNDGNSTDPPAKRNRGRPPGSGKKQLDALGGIGGVGFTPHVIEVKAGEDIASKIMAFSQQGPRAICILSACGAISNVTLRQQSMSGGTVTYEGRFEIISLSGSFLHSENNGSFSKSGSLSLSLAGPDGRILGGCVAGMLVAGSPVQVIVGSFVPDGKKAKSNSTQTTNPEPTSAPANNMLSFGALATPTSPHSQGPSSESSEENDSSSPLHRGGHHGLYGNPAQPLHPMQMYQLWSGHNNQ